MKSPPTQTYSNHKRLVPVFHFFAFGVLVVNLGWSVWRAIQALSFETVFGVFLAAALLVLFFCMRLFALTVQDRVIRLEMRLRLERILPADLKARIGDLSRDQFVALRFAGDGEIADLMRWALESDVQDRDAIKRRIKDWQPDHLRC